MAKLLPNFLSRLNHWLSNQYQKLQSQQVIPLWLILGELALQNWFIQVGGKLVNI